MLIGSLVLSRRLIQSQKAKHVHNVSKQTPSFFRTCWLKVGSCHLSCSSPLHLLTWPVAPASCYFLPPSSHKEQQDVETLVQSGHHHLNHVRGELASLGLLLALLAFLCIILNQIRSLFSFPCPLPRKKHRWLEETWLPPKKGAFEVVPDLGKSKRHLWKLKDMLLFWHILSHLPPWKVAMLREKPDTIASFKKTIAGQEIVEDHFVDQGETWQMYVGYLYNGALQNVPHVHEVHKIKSHGLELQRRNQNQRSHLSCVLPSDARWRGILRFTNFIIHIWPSSNLRSSACQQHIRSRRSFLRIFFSLLAAPENPGGTKTYKNQILLTCITCIPV